MPGRHELCQTMVLAILVLLGGCSGEVGGPAAWEPDDGSRSSASFTDGSRVEVCNTTSGLNLRSGPGKGYTILDVLSPGTAATVLACSGSWVQLDVDGGQEGWGHGSYLCPEEGASPPSDPPGTPPGNPPDDPPGDTSWSCSGTYATKKAGDGNYYLTSFGCWVDSSGTHHSDPGDNCIPACLSQAKSDGICQSGWSGKVCEEQTSYYVADSGRFGCLARLRITNPASGAGVVAVVLDAGPACWVEAKVQRAILDASPPVALALFGSSSVGWSSKRLVHVVEVDASTPLGPTP